ncbi:MAG: metal-dependent hydrolase [Myxococcota bacterium]
MAHIEVRKIRFRFDKPLDLDVSDEMLTQKLSLLGLSMTMPYLEPYLMRTMKAAQKEIRDTALAQDARKFSQQEGHHYRNHALLNDQIRRQFDDAAADELRRIEAALDADYQRFSARKPPRFNLAYAEGFEAMTCSLALAMAEHSGFETAEMFPGGEIWAWHMAEEIEHRTVAFDVYQHLVGSYPYRLVFGTWAQYHYVSYVRRFARCMADALGYTMVRASGEMQRSALRRYLGTLRPTYDPAKVPVPDCVDDLLARYSAMAAASA